MSGNQTSIRAKERRAGEQRAQRERSERLRKRAAEQQRAEQQKQPGGDVARAQTTACRAVMGIGMSAALAKRAAPEPEVSPVDAAAGIVADISERLNAAHTAAEQISAARAPLAFDASRGDADAVTRLAELMRASAANA